MCNRAISKRCSSSSTDRQGGFKEIIMHETEDSLCGTLPVTIPLHPGSSQNSRSSNHRGRNKAHHHSHRTRRHTTALPHNLRCTRSCRSIPLLWREAAASRVYVPALPGRFPARLLSSMTEYSPKPWNAFSDDIHETTVDGAESPTLSGTHGAVTCTEVCAA